MHNKKYTIAEDHPFIIHADQVSNGTLHPTHTHALTEVGMPEFIMDHLTFGQEGNTYIMEHSYIYFKNNPSDLQAVLNGEIIKLPINEISQKWNDAEIYTICFRSVPSNFEAVKMAYSKDICPKMRFVHIFVEGDDSALNDEYYRNVANFTKFDFPEKILEKPEYKTYQIDWSIGCYQYGSAEIEALTEEEAIKFLKDNMGKYDTKVDCDSEDIEIYPMGEV
jgi:hypothetical protein